MTKAQVQTLIDACRQNPNDLVTWLELKAVLEGLKDLNVYLNLTTTGSSGAATYDNPSSTLNIPNYGAALSAYVPYTGATTNLNMGSNGVVADYYKLNTTPVATSTTQGSMYWDGAENTVALVMNGTTQKIGQDQFYQGKNSTGVTIGKGQAVGFAGTDGNSGHLLIKPFLANGSEPSQHYMGIAAENIANGATGKVISFGKLEGINTSAYTAGDILYVSTSVAGGFQTTVPSAPNNIIVAAAVISASNNGKLMVRETLGSNINNDEGVKITTPTNGQVLKYNSTTGLWENSTDNNSVISVFGRTGAVVAQSGDYTTTQVTEGTNLYYTDARARAAISLTTSGSSGAATYNSSTGVLNIPNYAPDLSAYVQGSGTANYIPKFTAASTIANSQIEDNGTSVGIGYAGSTPSLYLLDVNGESRFTDDLRVQSTTGNRKIRVRSGGSVGIELADTRATTGKTWSIENGVTSGLLGFYESSSAKFSLTTAGNGEFAGTLKASIPALATASNAYVVSDGGVLKSRTAAEVLSDIGGQAALTNPITGTGTANYVSKFTASGTIGNSTIYDNGTFVGIGTTTEVIGAGKLQVNGGGYFSGNLGIGVTPSAWYSGWKALQGSSNSSFAVASGGEGIYVMSNAFLNTSAQFIYTNNGNASYYQQYGGGHYWYTAPSGTAGNAITFTAAMTLDASGRLIIGTNNVAILQTNAAGTGTIGIARVTSGNHLQLGDGGSTNPTTVQFPNGRILIGTTTDNITDLLQVAGSGRFSTASSGVSPRTDLGGTIIAEGSTRAGLYILTSGTSASNYGSIWWGNGNTNTDAFITVNNSTRAMAFGTADGERMRITSGGRVLIGTTTDNLTDLLQVAGSGRFEKTGSNGITVASNTSGDSFYRLNLGSSIYAHWYVDRTNNKVNIGSVANVPLVFETNSTERFRIGSSGDLTFSNVPESASASTVGSYLNVTVNGNSYLIPLHTPA